MSENLELREWIAVNVMGAKLEVKQSCLDSRSWSLYVNPPEGKPLAILKLPYGDKKPEAAWSENVAYYLPPYELTWNDAVLVVEAMRARSCWLSLIYKAGYLDDDLTNKMAWVAEFRGYGIPDQPWTGRASQHSAPLAICLAAKAAIEATK